ncbi:U6 snRNA phosphodiesterase Usb1 [Rhodocollybia butyracea]|uniref:U6 snRNA phosphodiesterase 1 n=1 Tax=Rhodocollybia butyracea TaxID=206335 RepID=A0A9P5Q614_9AGAR|nr:U6 snRNA phosphodiesterase Usb1 [Rhodocollybia butyracea]
MKRDLALVSYSSSEEETDADNLQASTVKKKKKLPSLSSSLIVQTPKDDPSLHQGRIRTTPHVEGQWASHVYVSIKVEKHSPMYKLVLDAIHTAKELEPALHDFKQDFSGRYLELHISLSRPIFLRTHQKDDLKRTVRSLAEKSSCFKVSFTTFSALTNDEQTRTFLSLDVGSGHSELQLLSNGLLPFLSNLRQKEYYAIPHFHASIAWALLDTNTTNVATPEEEQRSQAEHPSAFRKIPQLSPSLIATLNAQYASTLSSKSCSVFEVQNLCVKIGKDVSFWMLKG